MMTLKYFDYTTCSCISISLEGLFSWLTTHFNWKIPGLTVCSGSSSREILRPTQTIHSYSVVSFHVCVITKNVNKWNLYCISKNLGAISNISSLVCSSLLGKHGCFHHGILSEMKGSGSIYKETPPPHLKVKHWPWLPFESLVWPYLNLAWFKLAVNF